MVNAQRRMAGTIARTGLAGIAKVALSMASRIDHAGAVRPHG
jgi:hypothetical protein